MVRDKTTGKFVSDLTNPRHKYWEKKLCAFHAIQNSRKYDQQYKINFEVVEFDLVESAGK